MIPRIFLCHLLAWLATAAYSQKVLLYPPKHYKIDVGNTYIKDELIFDNDFVIALETPSLKEYYKKGYFYTSCRSDEEFKKTDKKFYYGEFGITEINDEDDKKKTWNFIIPDLYPNREFVFLMPYKPDIEFFSKLHDLNLKIYFEQKKGTPAPGIESTFKNEYEGLFRSGTKSEAGTSILDLHGYHRMSFSDYYTKIFNLHLQSHYDKIISLLNSSGTVTNRGQVVGNINILQDINGALPDILRDISSSPFITASDKAATLLLLNKFHDRTYHDTDYKIVLASLLFGDVSYKSDSPDLDDSPSTDYAERKKNMNELESVLSKLESELVKLKIVGTGSAARSIDIPLVHSLVDIGNGITGEYAAVENIIAGADKTFFLLDTIKGSTLPLKYMDRLSNLVKADIGIVSFKGIDNKLLDGPYVIKNLRPYFGLTITPFASGDDVLLTRQRWFNRLFIHGGLTLGSLAVKDVREDFFSKNNVMVGIGGKITQTFHASMGSLFYTLKDGNPLIKNTKTGCGFYIALGFHPNLNEIIPSLTGQIFK